MKKEPYSILFENEQLAAVNKESGIAVCAERWENPESLEPLVRLLEERFGKKLYICHRIDKETSGIVVFAKTAEAHRCLSGAFEKRLVKKTYTAVIHGKPSWEKTACRLPLLPNANKKHQTIIEKFHGKESVTEFTLLFSAGGYSVIEAHPLTGRTHQIRVHAAALGHPITGDALYGPNARSGKDDFVYLSGFKRAYKGNKFEERPLLSRLGLHAAELSLPFEGGMKLEAPLPKDMKSLITQLKKAV